MMTSLAREVLKIVDISDKEEYSSDKHKIEIPLGAGRSHVASNRGSSMMFVAVKELFVHTFELFTPMGSDALDDLEDMCAMSMFVALVDHHVSITDPELVGSTVKECMSHILHESGVFLWKPLRVVVRDEASAWKVAKAGVSIEEIIVNDSVRENDFMVMAHPDEMGLFLVKEPRHDKIVNGESVLAEEVGMCIFSDSRIMTVHLLQP